MSATAAKVARQLGPGHTIVTILCDYGNRYQSKLFNPDFLTSKGLPVPEWLVGNREGKGGLMHFLALPSSWAPFLRNALTLGPPMVFCYFFAGRPLRFAMLKGRSNYLCRAKLDVTTADGIEARLDFGDDGVTGALEAVQRLAAWAEKAETGDRADAERSPGPTLGLEAHRRASRRPTVRPRPGRTRSPSRLCAGRMSW